MQSSSGINIVLLIISLFILLIGISYQPLPEDFPQPWKYCFLSYWAHKIDQLVCEILLLLFLLKTKNFLIKGSFCEQMNLFTRVNLIRNLHYLSIGLFQKRYSECHLKV
jgi:hypothetical protein